MKVTLFEPPPQDPSKSHIENILELTPISDIGPDVFTNTRPLWHPPGARGIYGGAAIAQCLAAAQLTVGPEFSPHSMHCYFVLAGDSEIPIIYHVERVREGRSFATRTVQARQRGKPIFTTTISFDREGGGGAKKVEHSTQKPDVALPPANGNTVDRGPFETRRAGILNRTSPRAEQKAIHQFVRARGTITGGQKAHLSALAYMSDSYFIGTVARVQNIPRFASPKALKAAISKLKNPSDLDMEEIERSAMELARQEAAEFSAGYITQEGSGVTSQESPRQMGMMVSLDHTIYFHKRGGFRADEWLFTEMTSPWAGDERGLVMQKIWAQDGTLVATCVQEGVVRLKQDSPSKANKL